MTKKQVGITKPIMVVQDLINNLVPELQPKLNFVNKLYGKIREQLKNGQLNNIDDIRKAADQLEDKNLIKEEDLNVMYNRIIDHSKLISIQNDNISQNLTGKSEETIKLEKTLSCDGKFSVNVNQKQLSHAGTFSILSVLPFVKEDENLLLSYFEHTTEIIATMKLVNARIVSQINNPKAVESVTTFGTTSFLAMATTHTIDNTENICLFSDPVTTASVLKNDPSLQSQLNEEEIKILLTLVESEAKKVPNIERGKQIFQEIIKSKMQSSSPDDQEWYNEYLAALDISSDMSHLNQNPIEIIKK
ncbi:hypothetical protein [Rickettsia endosymbiont of Pantilius tunicatus]|uniref:hypothetical protein n=1 Tax=Rickettsia endosymbiont of Pantilius tunicatus TaxID=3066267 RepID=UPI00376EBB73